MKRWISFPVWKKYETFFRSKNAQFEQGFTQAAGIPYQQPEVMVNSVEELEEAAEAGMFALDYAIPAEQIVKYTYDVSHWDEDLKYKFLDDVLDLGLAVTKEYYDYVENIWKVKYIQPKYLVSQYSEKFDYGDSDFQGHFEKYTVSELLTHGFTKDELMEVAKSYCGYFDNPEAKLFEKYNVINTDGSYGWYAFKVLVLEVQWKDVEEKRYVLKKNKNGHEKMEDVDFDYKVKKRDKERGYERLESTKIRKTYKTSWVVNSDLQFDSGCVNFMRRPDNRRTDTDYNIRQIPGVSLTKQLIPILDQIQLLWVNYQNSWATAFDPIMAVDMSMLENIKSGGNKLDPMTVLGMAKQMGVLPFKPSIKGNWQGGATTPIQYIQGGMGTRLAEFVQSMEYMLKMIADFTGLTPQAMGSSVDPNNPVGTSEMAMAATSNILKPYLEQTMNLKQMSAKTLVRRTFLSIAKEEETAESYSKIIGKDGVDLVKDAVKKGVDIELRFQAKPDQIQKQKFEKALLIALDNGRNKTDNGIDPPTYNDFQMELEAGVNIKKLNKKLKFAMRRYNAEVERKTKENIMLQGQQNKELKQMEGQNEMGKIGAEGQRDSALNQQKADNDLKLKRYELDPAYRNKIDRLDTINERNMQQQQQSQNPLEQQAVEQPTGV